jgi:hypothetical protein
MTAPAVQGNPLGSWTATLPQDVMLDSGVLYIGASIFSAQEGGLKFDPTKTIRQVVFDGQRSPIAGLDRTVETAAVLTGTVLQVSPTTFPTIEPGAATPVPVVGGGPAGATQLQPKQASIMYVAGDYLTNVRAIWQRGDGTYVQIRFPKALCTKWDLTGTDKEEAKWAITIEARLDMTVSGALVSNPNWVIEYFSTAP